MQYKKIIKATFGAVLMTGILGLDAKQELHAAEYCYRKIVNNSPHSAVISVRNRYGGRQDYSVKPHSTTDYAIPSDLLDIIVYHPHDKELFTATQKECVISSLDHYITPPYDHHNHHDFDLRVQYLALNRRRMLFVSRIMEFSRCQIGRFGFNFDPGIPWPSEWKQNGAPGWYHKTMECMFRRGIDDNTPNLGDITLKD